MSNPVVCIFHLNLNELDSENGIGYCNLARDWTVCGAETSFCQTPEVLRRNLLKLGGKKIRDHWQETTLR